MRAQSPSPDRIDEAFIKLCIEELGHPDQLAEVTDVFGPGNGDPAGASRWDTVADLNAGLALSAHAADRGDGPAPAPGGNPNPARPAVGTVAGAPAGPWQLRITLPDGQETLLPLEDQPITFGRGRSNIIVLKCDRVSRHHTRIELIQGTPRLDDLGSRNGTLVNGLKVPAAWLKAGDVVKIGSVCVAVEVAGGLI